MAYRRPHYWHWYQLPQWRALRKARLDLQPNCRFCAEQGIETKATIADHITPHDGKWQLFADPNNLQSLCASCHSGKKRKLERRHKYLDRKLASRWVVEESGWIGRRKTAGEYPKPKRKRR